MKKINWIIIVIVHLITTNTFASSDLAFVSCKLIKSMQIEETKINTKKIDTLEIETPAGTSSKLTTFNYPNENLEVVLGLIAPNTSNDKASALLTLKVSHEGYSSTNNVSVYPKSGPFEFVFKTPGNSRYTLACIYAYITAEE